MTIDELLAAAGLTANDEIPIWDAESSGEPTKKITAQQLAAAVVTLAAVARSGDTMTGNLMINRDTNVSIRLTSGTGITLWLDNAMNGEHGIYSNGYWDGASKHNDGKYLISRKTDGSVVVLNHYNKNEVDSKIASTISSKIVNVGTITLNNSGYKDIHEHIPDGIEPFMVLVQTFGGTTGAINITADGYYAFGAPGASMTGVKLIYYYRG